MVTLFPMNWQSQKILIFAVLIFSQVRKWGGGTRFCYNLNYILFYVVTSSRSWYFCVHFEDVHMVNSLQLRMFDSGEGGWKSFGSNEDIVFKENSTNLMDTKEDKRKSYADYSRSLLNTVHTRQLKFFSHLMQVGGLEKSLMLGKITGKKNRRRQHSSLTVSTGSLETGLLISSKRLNADRTREPWSLMSAITDPMPEENGYL